MTGVRRAVLGALYLLATVAAVPPAYRDDVNWPFGMDEGTPASPLTERHHARQHHSHQGSHESHDDRGSDSSRGHDVDNYDYEEQKSTHSSALDCSTACSSSLHSTLRSLFTQGRSVRGNLREACSEYSSALSCIRSRPECDQHETFTRLTSGLQYMCYEQRDAFDAVIECVDEHVQAINEECQKTCHAETILTGWALKDTLLKTLAPAVDAALTPNMMQFAINEGCRVGFCMLKCAKTKMNARCEGTAGSLFTEALVRPLSNEASSDATAARPPLAVVFSALLPTQCSFMFDDKKLRELRIGDEMNEDVRRMYAERKTTPRPEEALVNSIFDGPVTDPWSHNKQFNNENSPFSQKSSKYDGFLQEIDNELEREEAAIRESERRAWLKKIESGRWDLEEGSGSAPTTTSSPSTTIEGSATEDVEGSGERFRRTVPLTTTPASAEPETTTISEDDRHSYELATEEHPWNEVEEGSGAPPRPRPPRVFYDGSSDETTVIKLERTADNADLFAARRIEAQRKYRLEFSVDPKDQGELVCILRTDKAHAVNKIPTIQDYELDELLNDL